MKKAGAVVVAAVVTAAVLTAERESPGATGRGAQQLRQAVTPAAEQVVGAAGDAVLISREELRRQGVSPGQFFTTPSTAAGGLPDLDPNNVPGQGGGK